MKRRHQWGHSRFTGATVCGRCRLLPQDDEDMHTPCPGAQIHAWADGYGTWHASVKDPSFSLTVPQMRRLARARIIEELEMRSGPNGIDTARLVVRHVEESAEGWHLFVETWKEV